MMNVQLNGIRELNPAACVTGRFVSLDGEYSGVIEGASFRVINLFLDMPPMNVLFATVPISGGNLNGRAVVNSLRTTPTFNTVRGATGRAFYIENGFAYFVDSTFLVKAFNANTGVFLTQQSLNSDIPFSFIDFGLTLTVSSYQLCYLKYNSQKGFAICVNYMSPLPNPRRKSYRMIRILSDNGGLIVQKYIPNINMIDVDVEDYNVYSWISSFHPNGGVALNILNSYQVTDGVSNYSPPLTVGISDRFNFLVDKPNLIYYPNDMPNTVPTHHSLQSSIIPFDTFYLIYDNYAVSHYSGIGGNGLTIQSINHDNPAKVYNDYRFNGSGTGVKISGWDVIWFKAAADDLTTINLFTENYTYTMSLYPLYLLPDGELIESPFDTIAKLSYIHAVGDTVGAIVPFVNDVTPRYFYVNTGEPLPPLVKKKPQCYACANYSRLI
jgi:hypothetical protein